MAVNKTTAALYLIALSLSGFIHTFLQAEELGTYDDVFVADESRHSWVNERGGRTGNLAVRGALLSSTCTLMTNEVSLSSHTAAARTPLKLRLVGCGDGGTFNSGKREVAMTVSGSLVTGLETGGTLLPNHKVSGCDHLIIRNGNTFLLCWPDLQNRELLTVSNKRTIQGVETSKTRNNPVMLSLSINYE